MYGLSSENLLLGIITCVQSKYLWISTGMVPIWRGGIFTAVVVVTGMPSSSSATSIICWPFMVSILVPCGDHETPAQFRFAKSTPTIRFLLSCLQTINSCETVFPPICSSQVTVPIAPKSLPSAPTTGGVLAWFICMCF